MFLHVMYAFQSESTLYSCLNFKELVARSRREIWSLSDCNWTPTHNHLVHKETLNHLAKVAKSFSNVTRKTWQEKLSKKWNLDKFNHLYIWNIFKYIFLSFANGTICNNYQFMVWLINFSRSKTGAKNVNWVTLNLVCIIASMRPLSPIHNVTNLSSLLFLKQFKMKRNLHVLQNIHA